ncbi:hypothetical protein V496_08718 [Pseudogymnoascus sp. VKM F-4515 (FW-2607)]|nr:hypothetical protein V496_08718 [Pseudogymnoascus sp. VKM F-4515 (FW-2607)]
MLPSPQQAMLFNHDNMTLQDVFKLQPCSGWFIDHTQTSGDIFLFLFADQPPQHRSGEFGYVSLDLWNESHIPPENT